uniref:Uncharacterized protein n=1 Tax=Glossina austeni TaxID=7395 RepID=A0A1A9VW01_GLOAU
MEQSNVSKHHRVFKDDREIVETYQVKKDYQLKATKGSVDGKCERLHKSFRDDGFLLLEAINKNSLATLKTLIEINKPMKNFIVMRKEKEENSGNGAGAILPHIHTHHDGYRTRELGAFEHGLLDGDMFLQLSDEKVYKMDKKLFNPIWYAMASQLHQLFEYIVASDSAARSDSYLSCVYLDILSKRRRVLLKTH